MIHHVVDPNARTMCAGLEACAETPPGTHEEGRERPIGQR